MVRFLPTQLHTAPSSVIKYRHSRNTRNQCFTSMGKILPSTVGNSRLWRNIIRRLQNKNTLCRPLYLFLASFFFVKKKDGGLRPCIDYRDLNNITIHNSYPLPIIPTALEQLTTVKIFPNLIYAVPTIWWEYNSWGWMENCLQHPLWTLPLYLTIMPHGLASALSVYQCMIYNVLRDFLRKNVIAFIDNILIYSLDLPNHVKNVNDKVINVNVILTKSCSWAILLTRRVYPWTTARWKLSINGLFHILKRCTKDSWGLQTFIHNYSTLETPLTPQLLHI